MRDYRGTPFQVIDDRATRDAIAQIDTYLRDVGSAMGRIRAGQQPDGSGLTLAAVSSHHLLTDLTNHDDHSQYLYLAGRAGGQAIQAVADGEQTVRIIARSQSEQLLTLRCHDAQGTGYALGVLRIEDKDQTLKSAFNATGDALGINVAPNSYAGLMTKSASNNTALHVLHSTITTSTSVAFGIYRGPSIGYNCLSVQWNGQVNMFAPGGGAFSMKAAATGNYVVTWPSAQGGVGTVLTNDGSGTLSWAVPSPTADIFLNWASSIYWRNFANTGYLRMLGIGTDDSFYVGLQTPASVFIQTNSVSRIRVTDTGTTFGSTAAPTEAVDIHGSLLLRSSGLLKIRNAADNASLDIFSRDGSNNVGLGGTGEPNIYLQPEGTIVLRATTTGGNRVRIGDATAPAATLDLAGLIIMSDPAAPTKRATFSLSPILAGTTVTLTVQDTSGIIALTNIAQAITGQFRMDAFTASAWPIIDYSGLANGVCIRLDDNDSGGTLDISGGDLSSGSGTCILAPGTVATGDNVMSLNSKTLTVTSNAVTNTSASGFYFKDTANSNRRLRLVLSSAAAAGHTITLANSAARDYKLEDVPGSIVIVGNGADPPAAGAAGKVNRPAETAAIASTNLTNATPAGFYLVHYEMTCRVAGTAGTVTLNIAGTGDQGAQTTSSAALPLTTIVASATNPVRGTFERYLASGNLTYSTTFAGVTGAPGYALRIRCEFLG